MKKVFYLLAAAALSLMLFSSCEDDNIKNVNREWFVEVYYNGNSSSFAVRDVVISLVDDNQNYFDLVYEGNNYFLFKVRRSEMCYFYVDYASGNYSYYDHFTLGRPYTNAFNTYTVEVSFSGNQQTGLLVDKTIYTSYYDGDTIRPRSESPEPGSGIRINDRPGI